MNEEKSYNFTFTEQQINIIVAALSEIQFKVASPLIQTISNQYQSQLDKPT